MEHRIYAGVYIILQLLVNRQFTEFLQFIRIKIIIKKAARNLFLAAQQKLITCKPFTNFVYTWFTSCVIGCSYILQFSLQNLFTSSLHI